MRASERANDFLSSLVFGCVIALTKEAGNETDPFREGGAEEGKHFVVCRALDEIARAVAVCPPNYLSQLDVQCHE